MHAGKEGERRFVFPAGESRKKVADHAVLITVIRRNAVNRSMEFKAA
jgi:hypothetical protein